MSHNTGRMSHREAQDILNAVQVTVRPFLGTEQGDLIEANRRHRQIESDRGNIPDAEAIRSMRDALNGLVTDRLLASQQKPPVVKLAAEVRLFGVNHADTGYAAQLASEILEESYGYPAVTLVDATPIRTPAAVGTRYTFRIREDI